VTRNERYRTARSHQLHWSINWREVETEEMLPHKTPMLVAQSFASFVTKKCLEGEVPRLGSWPWFLKDVVGWIYFALAGGASHPIWTRTSWIEAGEGPRVDVLDDEA
jgi:hypothetical protein